MMAENCKSNGDYGSDFKRRIAPEDKAEEQSPLERKVQEYVKELLAEKLSINQKTHPIAAKLLDQEIAKVQSEGRLPNRDSKYVDIYREKPIKVTIRVLVPINEYPKFNFVGKLLGPKGNSLRRLQEETMCKMAILGRGSMRDRSKEDELRKNLEPKYAHLTDDLHVEISALGPAAEAHARIAFALAEIRKYLIPDSNDNIRKEQLREMEHMAETITKTQLEAVTTSKRLEIPRAPPFSRHPIPMRTATRMPVLTPRVMPAKTKIMSILDRARIAMEESFGGGYSSYEDTYDIGHPYEDYTPSLSRSYSERHYKSEHDSDYYRDGRDDYGEPPRHWKSDKVSKSTPRNSENSRFWSSPYSHSTK